MVHFSTARQLVHFYSAVYSPEIEKLQEKLAKKHNFTPSSHKMKIFGTCGKCKSKAK